MSLCIASCEDTAEIRWKLLGIDNYYVLKLLGTDNYYVLKFDAHISNIWNETQQISIMERIDENLIKTTGSQFSIRLHFLTSTFVCCREVFVQTRAQER